jgi:hypothetical protein
VVVVVVVGGGSVERAIVERERERAFLCVVWGLWFPRAWDGCLSVWSC